MFDANHWGDFALEGYETYPDPNGYVVPGAGGWVEIPIPSNAVACWINIQPGSMYAHQVAEAGGPTPTAVGGLRAAAQADWCHPALPIPCIPGGAWWVGGGATSGTNSVTWILKREV